MATYRLRLRRAGMFSNVNEVIQQVHLAEAGGYDFCIDWSLSCYRDIRFGDLDPWAYYFEPPFAAATETPLDDLPGGPKIACAKDNIITPRLNDGVCDSLLLPDDRLRPHRIITEYLRLLPPLRMRIEEFRRSELGDAYLGVHIRGAGRTDGGVPGLRAGLPMTEGVPLDTYFNAVDRRLEALGDLPVFVCTDSDFVLDEARSRYGSRLISFPAQRSAFGEMHVVGQPENEGRSFQTRLLGEEVLVEAYLLAGAAHFVHGNSNLVNFVLCAAPQLAHDYVYQDQEARLPSGP